MDLTVIKNILDSIPLIQKIIPFIQRHKPIPGLEITFFYGRGNLPGVSSCFYLEFHFFNNAGSKAQISNPRLTDATSLLSVHRLADRVKDGNFHPLKFLDEKGGYTQRHIIIETNSEAKTGIPLGEDYTEDRVRRLIGELNSLPSRQKETKYFNLKFLVALGNNKLQEKVYRY
jgi:hypothetical protein